MDAEALGLASTAIEVHDPPYKLVWPHDYHTGHRGPGRDQNREFG